MAGKLALIYARVSTARQAAEELPIEGQIENCRAKAAALDADVLQVFVDPGISGREEAREDFQSAVAFAEAYDIDYFITWSTARFVRDVFFSELYLRRLERAGVKVIYCTGGDVDRSTTGGYIQSVISALFDEVYSRNISADTTRSMMKNARDGFWNGGAAPFGYRSVPAPENPKRRKLEPLPNESWVISQIFEWRMAGMGARSIAARLNAAGLTKRGHKWFSSTLHSLLRNPAINGQIRFGRRPRSNDQRAIGGEPMIIKSHMPIISDETWHAVQVLIDGATPQNQGSPMSTHLFTGLLRCGACGSAMHMETAKGRSRRYSYYTCSNWIRTKACQPNRRSAPDLDGWLMQIIVEKVFTQETLQEMAVELQIATSDQERTRREKLRTLDAEIADVSRRRSKLMEVLEHHGRDAPNLGDLSQRLQELGVRAKMLMRERADLDMERAPAPEEIEAHSAAIRGMLLEIVTDQTDVRRTRRLLQKLLQSVVIHSDRVEIIYGTNLLAECDQQVVPSNVRMAPRAARAGNRVAVFELPGKLRRAA